MCKYVITYDIGTTGIKTCLIEIDDEMKILGSATAGYGLYVDEEAGGVKGGAEQDADEWWEAMCITTKTVFDKVKFIPVRNFSEAVAIAVNNTVRITDNQWNGIDMSAVRSASKTANIVKQ